VKAVEGTRIRPARPFGVAVVAIFLLLAASLAALEVLDLLPPELVRRRLVDITEFAPVLLVIGATLEVVAAIGLWRGSRRAWVLTMLLVGLTLISDLYLVFVGAPRWPRLATDIVIAFYLNQGVVRDYFEHRADDLPEPRQTPPPEPRQPPPPEPAPGQQAP
jgi:hypothetical protein